MKKEKKKSTKREICPWMSEIDTWNEHLVKKRNEVWTVSFQISLMINFIQISTSFFFFTMDIGDENFEFWIFLLKNHEISLNYKILDTVITAWEGSFIIDN